MPSPLPRFLTLTALSTATLTPRKVMERMLARREIVPDAEVMFGTGFQPMFSEAQLPAITQKCIEQRDAQAMQPAPMLVTDVLPQSLHPQIGRP